MIQSVGVMNLVKDIGERIADLRRARGMSQDELAELATLSRISIARYESGKIEPGAKALGRIADALEVSSDALLGRAEQPETPSNEPQTVEARIVSGAIDKLPKEQRERAVEVMKAVFKEYSTYFTRKDEAK